MKYKYKYLLGSIVVVIIWILLPLRMDDDAVCATMIFYPPCVIFIMLCYIIGLLKDIKSELGTHKTGSEEKFFYEAEKEESRDASVPETENSEEDAGK